MSRVLQVCCAPLKNQTSSSCNLSAARANINLLQLLLVVQAVEKFLSPERSNSDPHGVARQYIGSGDKMST